MAASLVAITTPVVQGLDSAEDIIAYACRVSNPDNQSSRTAGKLLKYCIEHKHWSVFETASMTIEIQTTRAIAAQILRHRAFTFQEFSQRYAVSGTDPVPQQARAQDPKNRQASHDTLSADIKDWWEAAQARVFEQTTDTYRQALNKGIAKECARFVLPLATPTKMYMTGSVRSFIHYIQLRTENGTQPEHQLVALAIKDIFVERFPNIAHALGWLPSNLVT